VLPHTVCENCGTYRDRMVIDVLAKLGKKEKKKKEKTLQEEQARAQASPQPLDPAALSQKNN